MNESKSNRVRIGLAVAACSIAAFVAGVSITKGSLSEDSAMCQLHAEITTTKSGETSTDITAIGNKDSCANTFADAITSYTNQAAQAGDAQDDFAASDADAASAPCAASQ
jgi:hypothetical protein